MEETISLREIFSLLKKRLGLIIAAAFIGLGIASVVTFFVLTPQYSSRTQLVVTTPQNANSNITSNDVNVNLQMINTYTDMITSDNVLEKVRLTLEENYGYDFSRGELKESLEIVQPTTNSLMFYIQSTMDDPVEAQDIANVTSETFQEVAVDVLNSAIDQISIMSTAVAETTPVSPNNKLNLALGAVIGLMLGVGLAFLLELLDRTIKESRFITDSLEFTILGVVPNMSPKELAATMAKNPTTPKAPEKVFNEPASETIDTGGAIKTRRSRGKI